MGYIEAIKDGFRIVHRNWQLVLVHLGMVIVSFIGFLILVIIPLAIVFIKVGIDLTGLTGIKDILRVLGNPSEIISKYFWLVLIVIMSLLFYIIIAVALGIYVFSGSLGVIGRALRDRSLKFSMQAFFAEAKKLFFRLLGFTAIIGILLIAATFVLGILGGGVARINQ